MKIGSALIAALDVAIEHSGAKGFTDLREDLQVSLDAVLHLPALGAGSGREAVESGVVFADIFQLLGECVMQLDQTRR